MVEPRIMPPKFHCSSKVIMLGDEQVGKTSVMNKYALGYFKIDQPRTKSMNFCCKK